MFMRLLYYSSSTIPSEQANSIQVMRMAEAFASTNLDVRLVGSCGSSEYKKNISRLYGTREIFEIKCIPRLRGTRLASVIYGVAAAVVNKSWGPDLIYGRCPHSLYWSTFHNKPFIYEVHDFPKGRLRYELERRLFRQPCFRRLVVISDALRQDYLEAFRDVDSSKVIVAHDGADAPGALDSLEQYCLSKYEPGSRLNIGYLGSLYPGKGVEGVIALANQSCDDFFHVVGGTGEEIRFWKERAPSNVLFHGRVDPSQTGEKLRNFDVLMLPARREIATANGGNIGRYTSPLKMFEYMATGRPIIASNLPVLKEVLVDRVNALLVSPDEASQWKAALEKLRRDTELGHALSMNALTELQQKYTWVERARKVLRDVS